MSWTERLAILSDEAALDFAEAVSICLPLGIRAYELRSLPGGRIPYVSPEAIETVIAKQQRHGLTLIGVSPGFCKGKADEPAANIELRQGFDAAFRLLDRLGVRRMTVFSYQRSERDAPVPAYVLDLLAQAAERCRTQGVDMLIENASSCWADTGANLAAIARHIGVRVTWDAANAQASGEHAYPDGYAHVRDLIAHVHCKNWLPGKGWVAISDGLVNMRGQIKVLLTDEYKGYFCVEPHQWHNRANATRLNTYQILQLLKE